MKMASVFAAGGVGPSEVLLRPSAAPQIPISRGLELAAAVKAAAPIDLRFNKNALKLQIRRRWPVVFASKSNPSDGDSIDYKSSVEIKVSDTTQGPPLLTILAGLLVLFLVFWIVGSILLWLISLIGALPPSK